MFRTSRIVMFGYFVLVLFFYAYHFPLSFRGKDLYFKRTNLTSVGTTAMLRFSSAKSVNGQISIIDTAGNWVNSIRKMISDKFSRVLGPESSAHTTPDDAAVTERPLKSSAAASVADCFVLEQLPTSLHMLRALRYCLSLSEQQLSHSNNSEDRLAELAKRRQELARRCELYRKIGSIVAVDDFVFDFTHRLAYCKNLKSGSSTMLTFLLVINGIDVTNFDALKVHLMSLQLFPLPSAKNFVAFSNNFVRLSTIRHPFRRAVSCYCNKFIMETHFEDFIQRALTFRGRPTLELLKELLPSYRFQDDRTNSNTSGKEFIFYKTPGKEAFLEKVRHQKKEVSPTFDDTPTFTEFVLCLAELVLACKGSHDCELNINGHLAPQATTCDLCIILPDLVFKVETMDEDLRYLAHLLKVPQRSNVSTQTLSSTASDAAPTRENSHTSGLLPGTIKVNAGNSSCLSYMEYMMQLTGPEIDVLYTTFYQDFQLLGYEPFD